MPAADLSNTRSSPRDALAIFAQKLFAASLLVGCTLFLFASFIPAFLAATGSE